MMKMTYLRHSITPENVNKKASLGLPRGCHLAYFRQT